MRFLLLIAAALGFSAFQGQLAEADSEYGYIRVSVINENDDHMWPVEININGLKIGQGFSHSDSGMGPVALTASHLAEGKPSSPVRVRYGDLGKNNCTFDFIIEFSFNRDFSSDVISLGRYKAPNDSSIKALPLGRACKGTNFCSENSRLQSEIEQAYKARKLKEANQKIEELQERLANLDTEAKVVESQIVDIMNDLNKYQASGFDQMSVDEWLAESEQLVQNLEEGGGAITEGELDFDSFNDALTDQAFAETYEMTRAKRRESANILIESGVGTYGGALLAMDIAVDQLINESVQLQRRLMHGQGHAVGSDYMMATDQINDLRWFQSNFLRKDKLIEAAKSGFRFTPAGDFIDACEFVTGKEFCSRDGRQLSNSEILGAGFGVFIGSRLTWDALGQFGRGLSKLELANVMGTLRQAGRKTGNFNLGKLTRKEADAAGKAWVGPAPRISEYRGHPGKKIYTSKDGLRQYREVTIKKRTGFYQGNLLRRENPSGYWPHNGHMEIKE